MSRKNLKTGSKNKKLDFSFLKFLYNLKDNFKKREMRKKKHVQILIFLKNIKR